MKHGKTLNASEQLKLNIQLLLNSWQGNQVAITQLLAAGADVQFTNPGGFSAVMLAGSAGHTQAVQLLRANGAVIDATQQSLLAPHLLTAASEARVEVVKALLQAGARVEAPNDLGRSPLLLATVAGSHETVQVLLDAKANIEQSGRSQWTALMYAAHGGNPQMVQALLDAKADTGARSSDGWTALNIACFEQKPQAVSLLLQANADVYARTLLSGSPLISATTRNDVEIVRQLLAAAAKTGTPEQLRDYIHAQDGRGLGALNYASTKPGPEMLQELLWAGGNATQAKDGGQMLLEAAVKKGWHGVAQILLEQGVDVNAGVPASALFFAALRGDPAMLELLCTHGADVNAAVVGDQLSPLLKGWSPLMAAVLSEQVPALLKLLSKGADIDARDAHGHSALHHAICKGLMPMAKALIENNADIDSTDPAGISAAQLAMGKGIVMGSPKLLETLMDHGADIHQKTGPNDLNALITAAARGNLPMVEKLLEVNARIEDHDLVGNTALMMAARYARTDTVKLLLDKGANSQALNHEKLTLPMLLCSDNGAAWRMGDNEHAPILELLLDALTEPQVVLVGSEQQDF